MSDLILYLAVTLMGYLLGTKVRDKKEKLAWTGRVQMAALMVLVLLMGMRMGSNEEVTANLSTIGLSAFVMTAVILVFSVLAIWLARKVLGIDRYGRMKEAGEAAAEGKGDIPGSGSSSGSSMTLVIVCSVAAGMAIGYLVIRNLFAGNMTVFDEAAGLGIKIGLCILLVFIGMDLGLDGTIVDNFRRVGLRIFVFPAAVVAATLAGALVCSLFLDLSAKECLAIGAGFGWYTLAPGIIMENGYVTASAVSFLHNVMRELFSILLIPLVARRIGYIETTGMPGAAAMDVCLPIVEKSTRSDIAVYSFVSGVIMSTLVPIMVPLIIG